VAERIAIVSDHAAYEMKDRLAQTLRGWGHDVLDLGTTSTDSVDYPDYGYRLAEAIADGRAQRGVALCGSGVGISIAVNRHPACRCALVSEPLSAALARAHNDVNVLALGARLIGPEMAEACVEAFLAGEFGGGRHQRRVDKLSHPAFATESA
jgi:ribose 5-phosphate isomerase B